MSKTTILYKDIAPGASEDAAITCPSSISEANLQLLTQEIAPAPSITAELNHWGLDGTFVPAFSQDIAFWSNELSREDCTFENPPAITVDFDEQYTSVGIFLVFDKEAEEYCSLVNIKWYQGDTLKSDIDFTPNSASYFCNNLVNSYDRVVITINKTSLPKRRAKLEQVIFGIYRYFDMTEIRSASIVNEMSLSNLELPTSEMKWVLDSHDDIEYMFQLKQPVEVRNDNRLIGVYYIDGSKRTGKSIYSIDCYDAFGVLDEITFPGGVYSNKSAKSLFTEIIGEDFEIDFADVDDANLTGAILPCTKREAAQQVLFAWGAYASTDGTESIRVFSPSVEPKDITKDQIFTDISVETDSIVTEVRVTSHSYTQDANGGVEINGVKYADTTAVYTVKNPNVTANDKQNIKEVTDATLVSPAIGQKTAQRIYDYYLRRNTHNGKIVWKGERLGDLLTLPNTWGSTNTGNVQKMEIALSNTVVASLESLGV